MKTRQSIRFARKGVRLEKKAIMASWPGSLMSRAGKGVAPHQTVVRAVVKKTGGYCWSSSKCRRLCFDYALAEDLRISSIQWSNSSHGAWKEDDQQYPGVFGIGVWMSCAWVGCAPWCWGRLIPS